MVDGPPYNMTEKKKILFFGLGSIGMRHAGLLDEHFDVEMAAYRTGRGGNDLDIKEFRTLDDAFSSGPILLSFPILRIFISKQLPNAPGVRFTCSLKNH